MSVDMYRRHVASVREVLAKLASLKARESQKAADAGKNLLLLKLLPDNPLYRLHRDDPQGQAAFFYRASYLCKAATKVFGDGSYGFDCSRI